MQELLIWLIFAPERNGFRDFCAMFLLINKEWIFLALCVLILTYSTTWEVFLQELLGYFFPQNSVNW